MANALAFASVLWAGAGVDRRACASEHPFHKSTQDIYLAVRGEKLLIERRTFRGRPEDRTRPLREGGEEALIEDLAREFLAGIELTVDGRRVEVRYSGGEAEGTAGAVLTFEADLGGLARGPHVLRAAAGPPGEPGYYVRAGPHTRELKVSADGRTVEWAFDYAPEAAATGSRRHECALAAGAGGGPGAGRLADLVSEDEPTLGFVLVALAIAAGLGALHSVSPGHGKAMVAAYLIGSRGRVRDACLLGIVVGFTHVLGVLALGLVALVLTEHFLPQEVYPWLGAASGSMVFVIGYWMLASRSLGIGHHHRPDDRTGAATRWGLVWLGISGGIVPCPLGLALLLAAVALRRVAFGLFLIGAFSVGHAVVLVLVGILTVTAARLTASLVSGPKGGDSKWVKVAPVLSAGVLMLVGVSIAVNALASGGMLGAGR